MNSKKNDNPNYSMTSCAKTGIKINRSENNYTKNPFADANPFKNNQPEDVNRVNIQYDTSKYENLDLNLSAYSREEIYQLFGFKSSAFLTEENMKEAKKIVLKTHPDKSRLNEKYFLFFQKAYQTIKEIYEFQNKLNAKKTANTTEYYEKQNTHTLDKMFNSKKELKEDPDKFNHWFNEQFDKHRVDDPVEHGYGDWLKSDSDIDFIPKGINKDTMEREMEKKKHKLQELMPYKGIGDSNVSSSAGGSSLMEYNSNFSSGSLFSGGAMDYTDLRQAYVESVIPVTQADFNKVRQFNSIDEYKRFRENSTNNDKVLTADESMRQLYNQDKQKNEESAALAFYYAQQSEKVKQNNTDFWSGLNRLTN
jgi:hypothetical protein